MEISEEPFTVAQMREGSGFHWGCSSWMVRSEYVFWKLEPTETNGLDGLGEERKEKKESRISIVFGLNNWVDASVIHGDLSSSPSAAG